MRLNTDGMVIREQNIGEADRRVILLTRDYGIVHAFARGARRIKSNALTATQLLSYSRFSIFQGRDSYIIDEAGPIEVFFCSAWKHGGALPRPLFCPAYGGAGPGADDAEPYLRLILNTLHLLSSGKRPQLQLKAIFEMRLLSIAGYMPNLVACETCGAFESDPMFLTPCMVGSTVQTAVQKGCMTRSPIGIVTAMRHIVFSDFDKVFHFTLPDDSIRTLANISERYLLAQTQRGFQTLDFYHQVSS